MSDTSPTLDEQYHVIELRFGRNVETGPMVERRWVDFQEAVLEELHALAESVYFNTPSRRYLSYDLRQQVELHLGRGSWTSAATGEDVPEESGIGTLITNGCVEGLEELIDFAARKLAERYDQDAVAWVVAPSHMGWGK